MNWSTEIKKQFSDFFHQENRIRATQNSSWKLQLHMATIHCHATFLSTFASHAWILWIPWQQMDKGICFCRNWIVPFQSTIIQTDVLKAGNEYVSSSDGNELLRNCTMTTMRDMTDFAAIFYSKCNWQNLLPYIHMFIYIYKQATRKVLKLISIMRARNLYSLTNVCLSKKPVAARHTYCAYIWRLPNDSGVKRKW